MKAIAAVILTLAVLHATHLACGQSATPDGEAAAQPACDIFGGMITQSNDMDKWHSGTVKTLTDNTVIVEGMDFKPDALKGKVINPNFDRPIKNNRYCNHYYRIVSNTADTITTDPADGSLTRFAKPGDKYLLAGFFRIQNIKGRWVMLDPLDHPFLPMGPCTLHTNANGYMPGNFVKKKYGDDDKWWSATIRRLRSLGWTASMGYGYANWPDDHGSRRPMLPYFRVVRAAEVEGMRPIRNGRGWLESPLKNILDGIHGRSLLDVFDPSLAKAYGLGIQHGWGPGAQMANDPWAIGYITEESDAVFGLLRPGFHLGWCALACKPTQERSARDGGFEYKDTKVYTKRALAGWLRDTYGTIEKLNAAWDSKYTSFGSDGGWGQGSGLLDEDGKLGKAWMGKPIQGYDLHAWEGANSNCKNDLLKFQSMIVEKFYQTEVQGLKAHSPNHLVMGWCNNTPYPEDYFAESRWVDMTFSPPPDSVMQMKDTGKNAIKPCLVTGYMTADEDSALAKHYPNGKGWRSPGTYWKTQALRGEAYYDRLVNGFSLASASGVKPVIGMVWWAWGDDSLEKRNWGVCSFKDNLYDGKEAAKLGADGEAGTWDDEDADYGDCVTKIRQANAEVARKLVDEMRGIKTIEPAKPPAGVNQGVPDSPEWYKDK